MHSARVNIRHVCPNNRFDDVRQEIDSFWRGNASHIDFYNVQLDMNPGGSAIEDMRLKVFLPDADARERVQKRLQQDRQLLPYKRASVGLAVPTIEFVQGKLDPSTCSKVWEGSTLFDSPWYHNVFHLHAKNIIPTSLVLATSPPLVRVHGSHEGVNCQLMYLKKDIQ